MVDSKSEVFHCMIMTEANHFVQQQQSRTTELRESIFSKSLE
eukprot:SAG31_NODE_3128_length_4646_cov_3.749285_4_plen_42_part_00